MCLIIVGNSSTVRAHLLGTQGMLESVFGSNPDGFGVMYAAGGSAVAVKSLPKSIDEARGWLEDALPRSECDVAVHARFATHGSVSENNTHPYPVDGGFLMHNGILQPTTHLATDGNSDTWHFCRQYLDGATNVIFSEPDLMAAMAEFIGDNRFVFLDSGGRMVIVNKEQGLTHEGVWYANTYAWNPAILDPSLGFGGWMGAYEGFDRCGNHIFGGSNYGYDEAMAALDFAYAIAEGDASDAARALESVSIRDGVETLLDTHEAVGALYLDGLLSTVEKRVQAAAIAEDADELVNLLFRESYEAVEALVLTIEWRERESGRWVPDEQEEPAVEHLRLHEMTDAQYEEMYAG